MREIFILTGLSSKARKDGDTDVTVTLKTQVSPDYAGTLLTKLTPLAHRFIIANLEKQQTEIDMTTGEES